MKNYLILIILLFGLNFSKSYSQIYVGGGIDYAFLIGNSSDVNQNSLGYAFDLELRKYCQFWIGLRVSSFEFEPNEGLDNTNNYFTEALLIAPRFRYNLVGEDCYKYDLTPYIHGELPISQIQNTDELGTLGIGWGLGAGATYAFNFLNLCWMIDATVKFSSPNAIYKVEGRENLNFMNFGATLSVGL